MRHKTFMTVATFIFGVIGVLHIYRALQGIPVSFGTMSIPVTFSWVAGAFAIYMAYQGYTNSK